jgi:hypothetical protein
MIQIVKRQFNVQNFVLALSFLLAVLIPIIKYWPIFSQPINIREYEKKYSQSQYVLGEASPQKISDSELYVYAGYAYSRGEDPTTLNFEHPPLGKYAYGWFYQLFRNPYLFNIPLYIGILYLFYLLTGLIIKKWHFRAAAILVLASLSLFQAHLRYALLDLPLLFGYLLFFYGLLAKHRSRTIKGTLMGLGLGVALTVKYPFPLAGLLLGFMLFDSIKNKEFKSSLMSLLIAASIYLVSYWQFFSSGHNILDWIAFEKYRLSWFMGKTDVPKFLVFQTLFTGKYKAWWEENSFQVMKNWSLSWPILFVGSILSYIKAIAKKHYSLIILLSFSYTQLMIYAIGSAASDRFFITLLPFWILGVFYLVDKLKINADMFQFLSSNEKK